MRGFSPYNYPLFRDTGYLFICYSKKTKIDMRKILIFSTAITILILLSSYLTESNKELGRYIKVVIRNDNRMRPITTTIDNFWKSDHLSVISFYDTLYYDVTKHKLSKLKMDSLYNNFSINAAIIFVMNKEKYDTVYTDMFFSNWMIGSNTYSAKDPFLEKLYGPLYLGFYKYMNKAEN